MSDLGNRLAEDKDVVDPERADSGHDRLRYDVCRVVRSSDADFEDRCVNLSQQGEISVWKKVGDHCNRFPRHLFLQKDVKRHDREVSEVCRLLCREWIRSLSPEPKANGKRLFCVRS